VGTLKPHHRFMLTEHLALIDTLDEAITRDTQEIEIRMESLDPETGRPGETAKEEQQALKELPPLN